MGTEDSTGRRTPHDAAQASEASALWHFCGTLIEASPLPIAAAEGPEHLVRSVNAAFCRLIGAVRETVIGRPFAQAVPAWSGSQALLDRVARTGATEALVDQPQAPPGAGVWSCTVWPVQGPAGQPVAGVLVQVTETPAAEQFRHQLTAMTEALVVSSVAQHARTDVAEALTAGHKAVLEAILEQVAEEIVVRDAQGRLLWANAEARRELRPVPGGPVALEGTPLERAPDLWGDLREADGQPLPLDQDPIARALRGERVPPLECHRGTPESRRRALLNSAAPIVDPQGALVGAVAISIDITPQKHKEAELRQAHATLEQRVAARTAELSEAAQRLEVQSTQLRAMAAELTLAEQRERQRVAQLLHDGLQQLLATAKLRVNLLRRVNDPTVRNASQNEIQGILDECIAFSRTLTGELSPPILQSGGLLPALAWLSRWMQEKHGLTVRVAAAAAAVPTGEAVNLLLFHAVRELLFNTVKHAQVDTADIEVRHHDGSVALIVSDRGVGFDPATIATTGGNGFGLFSIRERLRFLGGRLDIDSAPGHGCRITLSAPLHLVRLMGQPTLPRSEQHDRFPGIEATAPTAGAPPIRVLLVDDHPLVRQGLALALQQEPDIEIVGEAADGEKAVTLARQLHPDVITMDISMPGMDGIAATRAIHAEFPAIRIIGLSMFEESDRAAAIREAGAVHYVTKSGPADALLAAVRTVARQP